jgi:hypothetical protein
MARVIEIDLYERRALRCFVRGVVGLAWRIHIETFPTVGRHQRAARPTSRSKDGDQPIRVEAQPMYRGRCWELTRYIWARTAPSAIAGRASNDGQDSDSCG